MSPLLIIAFVALSVLLTWLIASYLMSPTEGWVYITEGGQFAIGVSGLTVLLASIPCDFDICHLDTLVVVMITCITLALVTYNIIRLWLDRTGPENKRVFLDIDPTELEIVDIGAKQREALKWLGTHTGLDRIYKAKIKKADSIFGGEETREVEFIGPLDFTEHRSTSLVEFVSVEAFTLRPRFETKVTTDLDGEFVTRASVLKTLPNMLILKRTKHKYPQDKDALIPLLKLAIMLVMWIAVLTTRSRFMMHTLLSVFNLVLIALIVHHQILNENQGYDYSITRCRNNKDFESTFETMVSEAKQDQEAWLKEKREKASSVEDVGIHDDSDVIISEEEAASEELGENNEGEELIQGVEGLNEDSESQPDMVEHIQEDYKKEPESETGEKPESETGEKIENSKEPDSEIDKTE